MAPRKGMRPWMSAASDGDSPICFMYTVRYGNSDATAANINGRKMYSKRDKTIEVKEDL